MVIILSIFIAVLIVMGMLAFWLGLDKILGVVSQVSNRSTDILEKIIETREITIDSSHHMVEALKKQVKELQAEREHMLSIIKYFKDRDDKMEKQAQDLYTKTSEVKKISENLIMIADKNEKKGKT